MKAGIATIVVAVILLGGGLVFALNYYGSSPIPTAATGPAASDSPSPAGQSVPVSTISPPSAPAVSAAPSPRRIVIPPPTAAPTNSFRGQGDDD